MLVHILVLNYNGQHLLADCLPSVLAAARASRHSCDVAVIDNDSTDNSVAWLLEHFPQVRILRLPNRGLCSFNEVVPHLPGPVAVLLNNDVKLRADCLDPWVEPLRSGPSGVGDRNCFMTAPQCRRDDGAGYEGFKTAVTWRWGLVQATALFAGHKAVVGLPDLTASAGAAMAVDCRKFAELGGFDPLYLPGRLEDLDFAFRAYQAGYHARYVPSAVVQHLGMATFGAVYGPQGCDRLALRNTLLFQWKNLHHPLHRLRQLAGLIVRLTGEFCCAPFTRKPQRLATLHAVRDARWRMLNQPRTDPPSVSLAREREFFARFHPRRMGHALSGGQALDPAPEPQSLDLVPSTPRRRCLQESVA